MYAGFRYYVRLTGGIMMEDVIAEILRDRRNELGLTQIEVAHGSGIELQQYQRFESGLRSFENCRFAIGLRICATLELDPYDLLYSSTE